MGVVDARKKKHFLGASQGKEKGMESGNGESTVNFYPSHMYSKSNPFDLPGGIDNKDLEIKNQMTKM